MADVVITINRHKLKRKFSRGFDSRKFAKIKPPRKFSARTVVYSFQWFLFLFVLTTSCQMKRWNNWKSFIAPVSHCEVVKELLCKSELGCEAVCRWAVIFCCQDLCDKVFKRSVKKTFWAMLSVSLHIPQCDCMNEKFVVQITKFTENTIFDAKHVEIQKIQSKHKNISTPPPNKTASLRSVYTYFICYVYSIQYSEYTIFSAL